MRLVVPFRSQWEVDVLMQERKLQPTILLVLVPGVREGDYLEPAPAVTSEEIPHISGVPSHIVPVGPDGSTEGISLRYEDCVILTQNTPPVIVWAIAALWENLGQDSVVIVDGMRTWVMAPFTSAATPEAPIEYDYGGD